VVFTNDCIRFPVANTLTVIRQGSISRELARNTGQRGYRNKQAESFAQERHKLKESKFKN
jgi:IS30 family transposase